MASNKFIWIQCWCTRTSGKQMCTSSSVYIIFTLRLYIELLSVSFWLRFVLVSMPSYLCCKTLLISLIIIFLLLRLWLSLRTKDRVWYSLFSLHLDATAVGSNVHFSFILFSYARFLCSVFISSKIFHFTSFSVASVRLRERSKVCMRSVGTSLVQLLYTNQVQCTHTHTLTQPECVSISNVTLRLDSIKLVLTDIIHTHSMIFEQ